MIELLLVLIIVIVGVVLYLLEQIPMDATIKTIIRIVAIACVVFYVLSAFGVLDLPLPRLRG